MLTNLVNNLFELLLVALLKKRNNVAQDLMRAMHAQVSLLGPKGSFERKKAHQRLARLINTRLQKSGVNIVLGVFPFGASTEESLSDLPMVSGVIGYGPESLAVHQYSGIPHDAESWDDPHYGGGVSSIFFFEGDASAKLPMGIYYRRMSHTARHNYLVVEAWNTRALQVLPVELCPVQSPEKLAWPAHEGLVHAFWEVYTLECRWNPWSGSDPEGERPVLGLEAALQKRDAFLKENPSGRRPAEYDNDELDLSQYATDDEDDDESYLGASTLAKLKKGMSLFDEDE